MVKIISIIKERGLSYTLKKAISRIKANKLPEIVKIKSLITDKSGIEIGGPSKIFSDKGFIPIYDEIKGLDGCNFSTKTLWEGDISSDLEYKFHKNKKGTQFISEATDLTQIKNGKYDFVISSHCLEHVANPMKAIEEWLRVLKANCMLLLVLPNKPYCFDNKRPTTEYSHILEDYRNNTQESDLTHLEEIMKFHDLSMDKPAGTPEQFRARSLKNIENRALHQHVFSIDSLTQIFQFFNLEVLLTHEDENLIIAGIKTS